MTRIGLSVLFFFSFFATATAQTFVAGDPVILESDNPRGVPLHRLPRSSLLGFAALGTTATVEETAQEGRWIRIRMDEALFWVLARNATHNEGGASGGETTLPDRSMLLEAPCEETGPRERHVHSLFIVCFDRDWRIPAWVAYRLSPNAMSGDGDRDKSNWEQDERIEAMLQAFDHEYEFTGWHRGHMAPAEAFTRTQTAVDFTHMFSNAVPQSGSVNSGAWSKLEKRVRQFVEDGATVWVMTGSLSLELDEDCLDPPFDSSCRCLDAAGEIVDPARQMSERIAIPSHTFKTFLVEDDDDWNGFAFVMTNIHRPMGSFWNYQYSIERLEGLLGFDLYPGLDSETADIVKSNTSPDKPRRRRDRCL